MLLAVSVVLFVVWFTFLMVAALSMFRQKPAAAVPSREAGVTFSAASPWPS